MGKGIFGFIKWLWRGKLFPEEASDKLPPMKPETFANIILALNHSIVFVSFEQAKVVADKIAERFSGKPWLTCVGVEQDKNYGHIVFLGINPDVLRLKPEELEYFVFTQQVDGVQVRLMSIPIAKALTHFGVGK